MGQDLDDLYQQIETRDLEILRNNLSSEGNCVGRLDVGLLGEGPPEKDEWENDQHLDGWTHALLKNIFLSITHNIYLKSDFIPVSFVNVGFSVRSRKVLWSWENFESSQSTQFWLLNGGFRVRGNLESFGICQSMEFEVQLILLFSGRKQMNSKRKDH